MLERYNDTARRVIFFARWEAGQYGSQEITTEHLLLALLRETKSLMRDFLSGERAQAIREAIEERAPIAQGYVSTSADVPLSPACISVLKGAAREADKLKDSYVGAEHLLLGLLNQEKCLATRILGEFGLKLSTAKEKIAQTPPPQRGRRWQHSGEACDETLITQDTLPGRGPEDIPPPQGARWAGGYVRKAESAGRVFYWEKRPCVPRDALRHRKSQRLCLSAGQPIDTTEFELIVGGWTHDHCVICWRELYQPNDPGSSFGYTNGQEWMCEKCYGIFVASKGGADPSGDGA
jgi:hypothetical protein